MTETWLIGRHKSAAWNGLWKCRGKRVELMSIFALKVLQWQTTDVNLPFCYCSTLGMDVCNRVETTQVSELCRNPRARHLTVHRCAQNRFHHRERHFFVFLRQVY